MWCLRRWVWTLKIQLRDHELQSIAAFLHVLQNALPIFPVPFLLHRPCRLIHPLRHPHCYRHLRRPRKSFLLRPCFDVRNAPLTFYQEEHARRLLRCRLLSQFPLLHCRCLFRHRWEAPKVSHLPDCPPRPADQSDENHARHRSHRQCHLDDHHTHRAYVSTFLYAVLFLPWPPWPCVPFHQLVHHLRRRTNHLPHVLGHLHQIHRDPHPPHHRRRFSFWQQIQNLPDQQLLPLLLRLLLLLLIDYVSSSLLFLRLAVELLSTLCYEDPWVRKLRWLIP